MFKRAYYGKAVRSPKATELLEDRDAARELFNAIKSMKPGQSPFVSVAGMRFRTHAKNPRVPAND